MWGGPQEDQLQSMVRLRNVTVIRSPLTLDQSIGP